MRLLKIFLIGIGVLAVLKGAMLIADSKSPASAPFHDRMLFCYQLLVITWMLLALIVQLAGLNRHVSPVFLLIHLLLITFLLEIWSNYLLAHPSRIPKILRDSFSEYYENYERNIIQYENCSEYDSAYFYSLKPNLKFHFANIEFDNEYITNNESLRDDNGSMLGPETICIGDSYTLGWGVEQTENFPAILEGLRAQPVLNTGMSSFGTAREIRRLLNADTTEMKNVVIQYSRNDIDENISFVTQDSLKISPASAYVGAIAKYRWMKKYFPGKSAITIVYDLIKSNARKILKGRARPVYLSDDPVLGAQYFLRVLEKAKINTSNVKIWVIDLNAYKDMNNAFLSKVDSILLRDPKYTDLKNSVKTVDLTGTLTQDDYYVLDAHLKPSGHVKVAKKLAKEMER